LPPEGERNEDEEIGLRDWGHDFAIRQTLSHGVNHHGGYEMDRRSLLLGGCALAFAGRRSWAHEGREVVDFATPERSGTLIVNTGERALFRILGEGLAMRYPVAVGKEGYDWAGIAEVGRKMRWPVWTPPAAMIARKPELARWSGGMPGGPENPLGSRALYLYANDKDTLFRIHGTNEPGSIGRAASSGCIRMLNAHIEGIYEQTPVGTKVIVL
jgi:lipoprotein-anchoring transpeptidase ErfK/SrfK